MTKTKKAGAKKTTTTRKRSTTEQTAAKKKSAADPTPADTPVDADRRSGGDRRKTSDRRKKSVPVAVERRKIERRVKVSRRRQIDPTTCERDYSPDELEFMNALDEYKRASGRMFPTCSEILEVVRKLGYEKLPALQPAEPSESETGSDPGSETAQVPQELQAAG